RGPEPGHRLLRTRLLGDGRGGPATHAGHPAAYARAVPGSDHGTCAQHRPQRGNRQFRRRRPVVAKGGRMSKGSGRQTQFDGESHRRLYEMIASANPATLMWQGAALLQASSEIHKIAEDLKAHIDHVPWEGEGGESFRRWSHHMAGESAKLATYTGTAGY